MKELIPMNECGLMADRARVDSRVVAEVFEKQHKNVLRDIDRLLERQSGLSEEFRLLNFEPSKYINEQGHKQPCYLLTRDGFMMLVMGYTGSKAMEIKEWYIERFNEMEQQITAILHLKVECPGLLDALKTMADNPDDPHVYSNEMNMLNRLAFGMTAKQFREKHEIPKGDPIRPHLSLDEAELLEKLQNTDIGLVYSGMKYQERKQKLEWCAERWKEQSHRAPANKAKTGAKNYRSIFESSSRRPLLEFSTGGDPREGPVDTESLRVPNHL